MCRLVSVYSGLKLRRIRNWYVEKTISEWTGLPYLCMLHEYHVMSRYIKRSVLSAVSRNRGRFWNVLSVNTGVCLCVYVCMCVYIFTYIYINKHIQIYIYIYTGCPRRNVPDFGRVFLMLKYTDITQKHLYPKLNGYGDNGQRSLKLWQLLHTYWLPNTY